MSTDHTRRLQHYAEHFMKAAILFLSLLGLGFSLQGSVAPSGLHCELLGRPERSVITNERPSFGWIMNSDREEDVQTAYHVLVSSSAELAEQGAGDVWDSGKILSNESTHVEFSGRSLQENHAYWWRVRTWDKSGLPSAFSKAQRFTTGEFKRTKAWPAESRWVRVKDDTGQELWAPENRNPVSLHPVKPKSLRMLPGGACFADFGRAAFATVRLRLKWTPNEGASTARMSIRLGEKAGQDRVEMKPGAGVFAGEYSLELKPGIQETLLALPRFQPRYPHSQSLPEQLPEVVPFRYLELLPEGGRLEIISLEQLALRYEFTPDAASFESSAPSLNSIHALCSYSTAANTFNGDFASSQRERMMYEADCHIQQLCTYAIDREYAIARYSMENMLYHATWPTEWIVQSIFMAHADYLYTGDRRALERNYETLKPKTLLGLRAYNGLISTRTGLQTRQFLDSLHFKGSALRDIVDWPWGNMSPARPKGGETDEHDFRDYNTVVNAFHYRALQLMAEIAEALGKTNDHEFYVAEAERVKTLFNAHFLDEKRGCYVDGIGSVHSSLHSNLFPLAFGLVPGSHRDSVVAYIKTKGMACGVYAAKYLLEALYDANEDEYAYSLLTADSERSWLNMLKMGSTMTTEAWDDSFKVNNSWNHAWSASPVDIIARKLMGVEPLTPGFAHFRIRPHPGGLTHASLRLPILRGDVLVSFSKTPKKLDVDVTIPANTVADVHLPASSPECTVTRDGKACAATWDSPYLVVRNVGSGKHSFRVSR